MQEFIDYIISPRFLISVVTVAGAVILWYLLKKLLRRQINKRSMTESGGRKETYLRVSANVTKYVIAILTIVFVLQVNGINVTSLVAGLGIVSAIAGLALQDVLKDVIMGTNILSDEFYVVGDVVKYKGITGKVISFTVKTTKIMDIENGNVMTVCNRNISEIEKMSDILDIEVPTPYEEDAEKVRAVMSRICTRSAGLPDVTDCLFLGTQEFADSAIVYRLRVLCPPALKPSVRRDVLRIIQDTFADNDITIPYKQVDIHNK